MLNKKFVGCFTGVMALLFILGNPMYAMAASGQDQQQSKEELIATIQERDPDALIFETQEDADKFFENLQDIEQYDIEVTESERPSRTRADEVIKDYDVKITHDLISAVHLCYSYTVKNGGRFFGSQVGEPFVTMNGYHPGADYEQRSARVVKDNSQHLSARFVVYYKYYIVTKPISLGSATYEYKISHDIMAGPRIESSKQLK